ncbi:MAG: response regulator [Bacteroidetes bacterium]|nr:response regulator [Bacteroidota bacterium]
MTVTSNNVENEMAILDFLIVDDSDPFVKLTKRTLHKSGLACTIKEAPNGKSALDLLADKGACPDVILLDMNMPVMNGFEFLDQYIGEGRCTHTTLIYMLTSSVMEQDKMRAKGYPQIKAYFEKPLTVHNIEQIIADLAARGRV